MLYLSLRTVQRSRQSYVLGHGRRNGYAYQRESDTHLAPKWQALTGATPTFVSELSDSTFTATEIVIVETTSLSGSSHSPCV
jgi:hypothetical protein